MRVESLRVAASVWLQLGSSTPAELQARTPHAEVIGRGTPVVWIEQPETTVLVPYAIPPAWAPAVIGCVQRRWEPAALDTRIVHALTASRLLVDESAGPCEPRAAAGRIERARTGFATDGHVNVAALIPDAVLGGLQRYYASLVRSGARERGDAQCPHRYAWHDERLARFWHHQLTRVVGRIVGEPVKPSYAYLAAYTAGARLDAHRDREQCEFTVSLLVDCDPLEGGLSTWPLWVQTGDDETAVRQAPGDGLLFRGRELTHRRDLLGHGQRSTSLLLHYVARSFRGSLR